MFIGSGAVRTDVKSLKTLDICVNSEWALRLAQGRRLVLKVMREQDSFVVVEPYRASLII